MYTAIAKLFPHLRAKHHRRLLRPSMHARKQRKRKPLEPRVDIIMTPLADLLVMLIQRPRVERPAQVRPRDINKTRPAEPALQIVAVHHGAPGLGEGRREEAAVLGDVAVFGEGVVVGLVGEADFLEL